MAANDVFIKFPGITGETVDDKHKGEIAIDSFSFSVENQTTIGSGHGGAGAGKAKFNEFVITKRFDKSSPPMFANLVTGTHYNEVVLAARKAGGGQQEYLVITLSIVFTTKYSVQLSDADPGIAHEVLTFVYGKVMIEYKEQKADGSLGGSIKQGWDQIANKKL